MRNKHKKSYTSQILKTQKENTAAESVEGYYYFDDRVFLII